MFYGVGCSRLPVDWDNRKDYQTNQSDAAIGISGDETNCWGHAEPGVVYTALGNPTGHSKNLEDRTGSGEYSYSQVKQKGMI